jgi:hypothetical protein
MRFADTQEKIDGIPEGLLGVFRTELEYIYWLACQTDRVIELTAPQESDTLNILPRS